MKIMPGFIATELVILTFDSVNEMILLINKNAISLWKHAYTCNNTKFGTFSISLIMEHFLIFLSLQKPVNRLSLYFIIFFICGGEGWWSHFNFRASQISFRDLSYHREKEGGRGVHMSFFHTFHDQLPPPFSWLSFFSTFSILNYCIIPCYFTYYLPFHLSISSPTFWISPAPLSPKTPPSVLSHHHLTSLMAPGWSS